MTIRTLIELQADGSISWQSPTGPTSTDTIAYHYGISPISKLHPPSLKRPINVKVPTAQDGFRYGDPQEMKEQAMKDLVEIHKRLRRQTGKPEIAETTKMPVLTYPAMMTR